MTPSVRNVLVLGRRATPFYNFKASQFSKWRAGAARVRGNTGRARLLVIGDSTVWGEGGGDADASNNRLNAKLYAWPTVLAARLTALGLSANSENSFGSGSNAGVVLIADQRNYYKPGWNPVATWDISGSTTMGGGLYTNTADTNAFAYQPSTNVDTFELWEIVVTTGGSIRYRIDAGSYSPLDQNGANALRVTNIPAGSLASHTLNVERVAGNAFVLGARAWNSTVNQVDVFNIGRGSATIGDMAVAVNPWSSLNAITQAAATADGVVIDATINDAALSTVEATYKSGLQATINASAAGGASVVLCTGNPCNPAVDTNAKQQAVRQWMRDLALSNNLPMVDQWVRYIDYATMVANNFMFNSRHPNKAGYADFGTFMGDTLNTWSI